MPPRRSSRSTRASVEPTQVEIAPEKPVPAKRKRQASVIDEEQENVKPTSRTRRSTSAAPIAPTRTRGRPKKLLQEIPESDDEDNDAESTPPSKKSRPSLDEEYENDSAEEEEVKPKAKRESSRKPSSVSGRKEPASKASSRRTRASVEPESTTVSSGRRVSSTSARSARTSSRLAKVEEAADDEQSDAGVVSGVIKTEEQPASVDREALDRDAEEKIESDLEVKPRTGRRKARAVSVSDEESREEAPKEDSPDVSHEVDAPIEEEEQSLLDPPKVAPSQEQASEPEEPQGPKPRLVIHKMALINFKSYAGRQEIGPFHKSFSAIVGPNGSGKSNTIDALLFVFGYRASKMRQGKLSELIHNSARYPDLDECSVEVHFREITDLPGPNDFEVVPDSDLIVARTAYKNNSSRYTINTRQSSYSEVQTLLKGRGIDLDHNRFLILQGEVESIAQMKPKAQTEHDDGLLEYLEDIIGTSKYKEPLEEALADMERLSEDRVEKLSRLKIVERERNALEAKKKEAEDYLRLQNEHVRALSRLWQWYIWRCLVNEDKYTKDIEQTDKELKDETERNRGDITHLEMLEKHYEERCTLYDEVKAAAALASTELKDHEKQQIAFEEKRKHTNTKAKKLRKSLQEDESALAAASRTIEDSTTKMEKEKVKLEELEEELAREEKVLEQIRDSLKDKTQVFHDQIEVKQTELQPWTAEINTKQAEIDMAVGERDMLAKKAEQLKSTLREAQEHLEKLQAEHQAKTGELEELKASKTQKQDELKAAKHSHEAQEAQVAKLRQKASSSRQKVDEAKASQAANTSQNRVLDSLTRLKNAGRISGFHGRLGSLGTIPDKYDVAVSTACGALYNLVVDTVDQGQACIEYLRKQNIGRGSFMVLEKLSSQGMGRIQTPENVPRLFDLIKPKEPRFAPAFYKGLRDTLVANDLDQANRIAFGGSRRWRVVTLAGQLIDASGTMSGGGTQVARGGMSSKLAPEAVSPETLREYEQESEQAQQELDQAIERLRRLEAQLESLTQSGPQLDVSIQKLALDTQTASKRIAEAEKRVRDLKTQNKPNAGDNARISELEEEIEASQAELENLKEQAASIQNEIKALEKKILEVGGARLLTQKSKVEGINLHINLANDEITKAEVAKAKAENDVDKLEASVKEDRAILQGLDVDIQKLKEEIETCVSYIEELGAKVEEAQAAVESSKDDLEQLKGELDTKREEIQAFRQKEMELKQRLNDLRKEYADNGRALEHWQSEHDKLTLEDIDDDDEDENEHEDNGEPSSVKEEDGSKPKAKGSASHDLHMYSEAELAKFRKEELIADAELLDEKIKNAKPDLSVLKDYRKREAEFLRRAQDLEEVTQARDAKKQEYEDLRKRRLDEFMSGFSMISLKLKEMYQMITLGGNAELELVDSMDPFSEGIIFSVMPPKKSWKNISNLSGGEKTLSSLALVFALHVYKPTPLYFMDEIDAALDFRNVSIVANYIKDRTKNAQFIIISLRNDMFELSHRLIGIYKTANATQSISIDNHPLHAIPVNVVVK
ncbi:RecF/RecN/SMC protein [Obba rivulosa]|uniref:Structural maintenance of chromosomes protein n=1 Tax=Obba rivulosa TaxID=1052685 RepID=A0A8E2DTU8_9APHY|nr:RecF/RecN/SMC protein [Obba rivulosa]